MSSLYKDVRSEQNLFSAWRHVRRSALNSSNANIRGFAAEFEHRHQSHLKRIADQLRQERFSFDPVKGVLKDKKKRLAAGKDPRPIAIATIRNRVVQRAILQVLQPRRACNPKSIDTKYEAQHDKRLRKLNSVNRSRYGIGGLMAPYGGVRPAIELAMRAMRAGGSFYYQSDIKAFFTKIPVSTVVDLVHAEIRDEKLTRLFGQALEVDLENKDELLTYARLFPSGGFGVAQGSSLSAFAGNVLLYDFDHELNAMDVLGVRYIDDLLIIADSEERRDAAIVFSTSTLSSFGFSLYPAVPGSDKASHGTCKDGFKFLGCTLQPNRCVPSKKSVDKISKDVSELISASKRSVVELAKHGKRLDPSLSRSSVLHKIGKKLFGWEKSFSFCTDTTEFVRLDKEISRKIADFEGWVQRTVKGLPISLRMQVLGIPSTRDLFLIDKKGRAHKSEA